MEFEGCSDAGLGRVYGILRRRDFWVLKWMGGLVRCAVESRFVYVMRQREEREFWHRTIWEQLDSAGVRGFDDLTTVGYKMHKES